jgi:SnoaL-like domain
MLDVADRLAIHELLGLYGHLIDQRRWDEFNLVFAPDAIVDGSDFGVAPLHSLAAITEAMRTERNLHPLAHHATNVVITEESDGTVRVLSKGIGVGRKGRVGSITYYDVVVRTGEGWRFSHRRAELRRPEQFLP